MNKELWLEFGFVNYDGWEDVCWYNEGRASEFPYFLKNLLKNTFKRGMYFKVIFCGKTLYLKRSKKKNEKMMIWKD